MKPLYPQEWCFCFPQSCGTPTVKTHWPSKPNVLEIPPPYASPSGCGAWCVGLRTLTLLASLCDIIIFQFAGHPHSGYEIWLCHKSAPPTISLWLPLYLLKIFFGRFQSLFSRELWFWCSPERKWAQVLLLHHLVGNQGAAFSLDTCCLFPRCVLAVIPFIWGVQVWRPLYTLETAGVALDTSLRASYRQLWLTHSWDSGDSTWSLLVGLTAVWEARAGLWILQWWWQLAPVPRAPVGSVLLLESTHGERSSYGGPTLMLMHHPPKWHLTSLAGPDLSEYTLSCDSYIAGSNVKWCNCFEKWFGRYSKKNKHRIIVWPSNFTSRKMSHKILYINVHSCIIHNQKRKQLKCLLTHEWVNQM